MPAVYQDFSDVSVLDIQGVTSQAGRALRLTPDGTYYSAGEAFTTQAFDVSHFSTHFQFEITAGAQAADGFVFVLRAAAGLPGATGGDLGYGGIANSLGVAFDTYDGQIASGGNVLVLTGGNMTLPPLDPNLQLVNSGLWDAWISYDGTTLEIRYSQGGVRPETAQLSQVIDLAAVLGSATAYAGFTGGTGGLTETVDITSWSFDAADTVAKVIYGSAKSDTITAADAGSIVYGEGGDDTVTGGAGDDAVYGGAGLDIVSGAGGNDRLDGGAGADRMTGGKGDDTYVVDDASDKVTESNTSGTDTVETAMTFALTGLYVENLTLTGSGNVNAGGNGFANILTGNSGNNSLNGGLGADTMSGGGGSDVYFVDNAGDVVIEALDEGRDTVFASLTYALSAHVESLTLTGYQAIDGTGNDLANILTGNGNVNHLDGGAGKDILAGAGGNDILTGGADADQFRFVHAGAANGLDHITDFVTGTDKLAFYASDYGFEASHVLTAAEYHTGAAVGAGPQFLYNLMSHTLYWDGDGQGGAAPIAVAVFDNDARPRAADFVFL